MLDKLDEIDSIGSILQWEMYLCLISWMKLTQSDQPTTRLLELLRPAKNSESQMRSSLRQWDFDGPSKQNQLFNKPKLDHHSKEKLKPIDDQTRTRKKSLKYFKFRFRNYDLNTNSDKHISKEFITGLNQLSVRVGSFGHSVLPEYSCSYFLLIWRVLLAGIPIGNGYILGTVINIWW